MFADTMLAYLSDLSDDKRLEFQVSYQCAAVLKGIKASNLMAVPKGGWKHICEALCHTEIICIPLHKGDKKDMVLLYRYERLEMLLSAPAVIAFLRCCGYERYDVPSVILELRRRYDAYTGKETAFPHELGIILDYPLEDVDGFMRHCGQNFIFCGYWKVYHNPEEARAIFDRYDKARDAALSQIMGGCSLLEVTG